MPDALFLLPDERPTEGGFDFLAVLLEAEQLAPTVISLDQEFNAGRVFTPEAVRHLQAVVGPDQIVMGSDWPYPWVYDPVDQIMACDSLNDEQKRRVLGETAAKLLNISA